MTKDDISFSKNEKEFKFGSKCISISQTKQNLILELRALLKRMGMFYFINRKWMTSGICLVDV